MSLEYDGPPGKQFPDQQRLAEPQSPIHVRMGERFAPVEPNRIPDLTIHRFVFKRGFTVEGIGAGHIEIVDIATALENLDPGAQDLGVFESYDAPYGRVHITRDALPDSFEEDRLTLFPLQLLEVRFGLNQPKDEVVSPVVLVEFRGTPYRYWAVDHLGDPADREYNRNTALYWEWRLEQTGKINDVAFDRNPEQLTNIRVTFFPQEVLPRAVADHII